MKETSSARTLNRNKTNQQIIVLSRVGWEKNPSLFLGNALFLITGIDKKYKTYKAYKIMYLKKNRHQTRLVFVLKVYKFTGGVGGGAASKSQRRKSLGLNSCHVVLVSHGVPSIRKEFIEYWGPFLTISNIREHHGSGNWNDTRGWRR